MTWFLVELCAHLVLLTWCITGMLLHEPKNRDARWRHPCRFIWAELRPFYLPAVVLTIVGKVMDAPLSGWDLLNIASAVWVWWLLKDVSDKDDRWKRRRKKAAEAIKRVGSRLVVVPAAGGGS